MPKHHASYATTHGILTTCILNRKLKANESFCHPTSHKIILFVTSACSATAVVRDSSKSHPISVHLDGHCKPSKRMHFLFFVLLAGVHLSMIRAQQNLSSTLPHCANCNLQASNESTCPAVNRTCACEYPVYAPVMEKCATKNCTASQQNVTDPYVPNPCSQLGSYGLNNATNSSTTASVGIVMPTSNGTMIRNSTRSRNGTFMGTPAPFTGGSGVANGCGALVLAGLLFGGTLVIL